MSLSELLKKGSVKRVEPDAMLASKMLSRAEEAAVAAKDVQKIRRNDVALPTAYDAMLNAGMALMAAKGYRAESEGHHKTIVEFCADNLGKEASGLVQAFNRYRMRRHDIVYGEVERKDITEAEALDAIAKADGFIKAVRERVSPSA